VPHKTNAPRHSGRVFLKIVLLIIVAMCDSASSSIFIALEELNAGDAGGKLLRLPTTAAYLTAGTSGLPLSQFVRANRAVQQRVLIVSAVTQRQAARALGEARRGDPGRARDRPAHPDLRVRRGAFRAGGRRRRARSIFHAYSQPRQCQPYRTLGIIVCDP